MSDDKRDKRDIRQDATAYDFRYIEAKWQRRWEETALFRVEERSDRPKFYGLDMFPYPSGAGISVGHCRNYVPLDVACRLKVMQGYNVLHPMGWDAFGQPAENEAIRLGRNPGDMVPEYAANYKRQLKLVGISYDWSREVNSSMPDYYRWTQWIFLLLYRRGLAYRSSNTAVNWCPQDKTVLANEEVVNGRCWRCNSLVEKRYIPQWFFHIVAYGDRLLEGLDTIQWPAGVKTLQTNWIGRSEGAEVDFAVDHRDDTIRVYTTRPDTLWGATFMVLAPEHPLVQTITVPARCAGVAEYQERAQRVSEIDRQSTERTKTGVFTGAYAVNPVNHQLIPIWVADYVLMGYGTGAIMAVPAHDQRDFEFARKYDIPIRLVYRESSEQSEDTMIAAVEHGGVMENCGPFDGLPNDKSTVRKVIEYLEQRGIGAGRVNFRLRDWLISRQRYWGVPIPIVHCAQCGIVPVPENELPVLLPDVERYQPTGTGESPLAGVPEFVNTACPTCGGPARRETDTMGGSACSSWYFLRFADPHNSTAPFEKSVVNYWLPVDMYAGGADHAVGHLLYARFWTKVLHDAGLIEFDEPFQRYRNQGMVLAYTPGREVRKDEAVSSTGDLEADSEDPLEDWKVLLPEEQATVPESLWVWRWTKMSKSKRNVVTPDEMAEKYGADSLRLFTLFIAPYEDNVHWTDKGIEGAHRFVNRVWRIWTELRASYLTGWRDELPSIKARTELNAANSVDVIDTWGESERKLRRKLHQTIRKVGEDLESFRFNTAVAALMELTNELSSYRNAHGGRDHSASQAVLLSEIVETLPLLMSPIMPHVADEWWESLGKQGSTFKQSWPAVDAEAAAEDTIVIVVQINGKLRERMEVAAGTSKEEAERLALECDKVKSALIDKQIRKVISVPGRLVNIVC